MTLLLGSLQLGLIYGLLALGVYLTFRVLNLPDLTADGSFTLGLSVSASFAVAGHPYLGLVFAIVAGCLAGSVTGLLQTKLGIHPILAGILTMSGLYSVNLLVLGNRSNLSLIGVNTLFDDARALLSSLEKDVVLLLVSLIGVNTLFDDARALLSSLEKDVVLLLVSLLLAVVFAGFLIWLMNTHLGLCIRATGDNQDMVRASSIDVDRTKVLALAIANGFVALSGGVLTQYQGFADIGAGTGIVTIGLASVIIGEVFCGRRGVTIGLIGAVCGAVLYRLIIALALKNDIFPSYMLKLVSSGIVVIALSIPAFKAKFALYRMKKEAMRHA